MFAVDRGEPATSAPSARDVAQPDQPFLETQQGKSARPFPPVRESQGAKRADLQGTMSAYGTTRVVYRCGSPVKCTTHDPASCAGTSTSTSRIQRKSIRIIRYRDTRSSPSKFVPNGWALDGHTIHDRPIVVCLGGVMQEVFIRHLHTCPKQCA